MKKFVIKLEIYSNLDYYDVVIRHIEARNSHEARRLLINQYLENGFYTKNIVVLNEKTSNKNK